MDTHVTCCWQKPVFASLPFLTVGLLTPQPLKPPEGELPTKDQRKTLAHGHAQW